MTTASITIDYNLASGISDRAFRLYCVLVLRTDGEWMGVPALADACGLKPHQIRKALTELRRAGLTDHRRRYERGDTGRKTWHTYVRFTRDTSAVEAAA